MNQYSSKLTPCLFDETNDSIDHILIDDVLHVGLSPIESQKTHALHYSVIIRMSSCAVDDVCDLIES